ncbi:electron transport complex subunit RsxC [Halorhodospira halochloris]|uniref:electron transport complex subunit RsxC n=1 Tax=Halorhodospira halochloris TaxID=1052 RepID=UPI001EE7C069|nr:electron transport complex subunit RsxC [Halorhodospira halochloris]MCG5549335.1 electron transport complex subunit RsxC [Halorhodospira halochloris]
MLNAVLTLTIIAGLCGIGLGMAGRRLAAQRDPVVERIDALLPQTQCGQCGYPGCRPYAEAVANQQAAINLCAPGGNSTAAAIADLLQVDPQPVDGDEQGPVVAFIDEQRCIGCTRCLPACPVDAIIGAPRQMHTVLSDECTGCKLCVTACPMDCITMQPVEPPLGSLIRPLPTPLTTRANPESRPGPLRHPDAEPRPGEVAVTPAKDLSRDAEIGSIPLPTQMILPLVDHRGLEMACSYGVGDRVLRGAVVTAAADAVPLHAPTSGEVIGIDKRAISHPANAKVKCLIIKADGEEHSAEPMPALNDPLEQPAGVILERIRQAGIRGMGGAAFPSALKLADAAECGVDTLVVNGVECDTYLTCDETLLRHHAAQIVTGARLAARACGASRILIAVKAGSRYAAAAARQAIAAEGGGIQVVTVDAHYPAGNERNIVYPATGRIVPAGARPTTVGVVIQNVSTLYAAYRAVVHGEPSLDRLVTVSGGSAVHPGNYWIRVGTPLRDVLAVAGEPQGRIMVGGGIMGIPITNREVPITHGMSGIILESPAESPLPEQPCIRCSKCTKVCPEGLRPHEMVSAIRAGVNVGEPAESIELDPLRCTGCASCDLVCPSSIPLAGALGHARDMTRARMAEREAAERAKRRNEAKKAREERQKREKEQARQRKRQAVASQNKSSNETTES